MNDKSSKESKKVNDVQYSVKINELDLNTVFNDKFVKIMNDNFDDFQGIFLGFHVNELKKNNIITVRQEFFEESKGVQIDAYNEKLLSGIVDILNSLK